MTLSYRITPRRRAWIEELAQALGLDPAGRGNGAQAIDWALKEKVADLRARTLPPRTEED